MDWNAYLYNKIESVVKTRPAQRIFRLVNFDGSIVDLDNREIYRNMIKYIDLLVNYSEKICVIYHNFDEEFIGLIIAAIKCHVKILIRRTSLENPEELLTDITFLRSILPVSLVFFDCLLECRDFEKIVGYSNILCIDDSYDYSCFEMMENEYDFIQLSSGTTESSKAFCLSIEGLIKSAEHIRDVHHVNEESTFLTYLTLSHIYGFVSGFLLPFVSDASSIFCKTSYIKNNPTVLFELISNEKVTHASVIINTLMKACEIEDKCWDLSSLVCASLGGEKVDYHIYERLLIEMKKYGMNSNALVNSYGMSEKGSITMEDPYIGNFLYQKDDSVYVSVGNTHYLDTYVVIFDDNGKRISDSSNGMVGVSSPYIAKYYYNKRKLCRLNTIMIDGQNYYHNGDCGFVTDGKLFITGRKVNTLTYNGLKLEAEILNEFIRKYLVDNGILVCRCFCFNYPEVNNHIVCFVDYDSNIEDDVYEKITDIIAGEYHIKIADYFVGKYESHGIEKISLPNIISRYSEYCKYK